MGEVTHLKTVTLPVDPVDEQTVERLERLLAMAKAGEFQGLAYVTVQSLGCGQCRGVGTGWIGKGVACNIQTTIGGIQVLNSRLIGTSGDGF